MAFLINDTKDGAPGAWEYLKASAIGECKTGMALYLSDGLLTKASGTTKPTYISMYEGTVASGDEIPVIRVLPDTRFATAFAAASAKGETAAVGTRADEPSDETGIEGLKVGDKVTIDATGLFATATTEGGVLEIVHIGGTEVGDSVIVRIP